ncbi:MAG: hypothetical protein AB1757_15280 [Acidobacteriota bacterium]
MAENDYSSIWTLNSAAVKEAVEMMKYLLIVMVATAIFIYVVGFVANL